MAFFVLIFLVFDKSCPLNAVKLSCIKNTTKLFFFNINIFYVQFQYENKNEFYYNMSTNSITYNDQAIIYKISTNGELNQLGSWTTHKGLDMKNAVNTVSSGRRFFRIGTTKVKKHFKGYYFLVFFRHDKTLWKIKSVMFFYSNQINSQTSKYTDNILTMVLYCCV